MTMEDQLSKLNNYLSKKRIEYFELSGICDKNGNYIYKLGEVMEFERDFDYYVSLISFDCSSLFPNIFKDQNDKLYYIENNVEKSLPFASGAYEVEDINSFIQKNIPNESIKLSMEKGNGRCIVQLKDGFKLDFTKENTFKKILGFDGVIVDKPLTISPNLCNVIVSNKIFINVNIVKGSMFEGRSSNILHSFSNCVDYGLLINVLP